MGRGGAKLKLQTFRFPRRKSLDAILMRNSPPPIFGGDLFCLEMGTGLQGA